MTEDDDRLLEAYEGELPDLTKAEVRLKALLKEIIGDLEDDRLVRATLGQLRIKTFGSVRKKAEEHGRKGEAAIRQMTDLLGARVVCNNVDDVRRFAELLRERTTHIGDIPPEVIDYIAEPKEDGYRALHVIFWLDVGESLLPRRVQCEVQIRTLLQDGWAKLTHRDIYKDGEDLPGDLHARVRDLARLLETADGIAGEIRERVTEERTPADERPNLEQVTENGLVHLFADSFGRYPSDYAVRAARQACEEAGLTSLSGVSEALADGEARGVIEAGYGEEHGWEPSREELFELIVMAVGKGLDVAVEEARERVRREWEYIDSYWRNDVLSELPGTLEEFIEALRVGEIRTRDVAEALGGGATDCDICGEDLIDAERFEDVVYEHYGFEGESGRVREVLAGTGDQLTDWENPRLCFYHAEVFRRDD